LALIPACGRTGHGDSGAAPSDAGVESARFLADSGSLSADGAGSAVEVAMPVAVDAASHAVEAAIPVTADGANPAVEAAIPVISDGAADRAAGDLLVPDVAAVTPDAVPDSPLDASPEVGILRPDGAVDGGDAGTACCSDSGTLDLETALSGKTLTYWVTTEWGRSDSGFRTFVPVEQDYVTVAPYAKDVVVFSANGSTAQVTAVQGGSAPVAGTRTSTAQGRWTYSLAYFAGGELVVWISGTTIYGAETQYGSGLPVIESTRGELRMN
jgi:hypothetical protein